MPSLALGGLDGLTATLNYGANGKVQSVAVVNARARAVTVTLSDSSGSTVSQTFPADSTQTFAIPAKYQDTWTVALANKPGDGTVASGQPNILMAT